MMQELFEAVRESTDTRMWSRGVQLSRRSDFFSQSARPGKVSLKLAEKGKKIVRCMTLWTEDCDWHCDCNDQEDPCVHVIAAVIAMKKANDSGQELPQVSLPVAAVGYRFVRKEGTLLFDRFLSLEGRSSAIHVPLTRLSEDPHFHFVPTKSDLAIDFILRGSKNQPLSSAVMAQILPHLQDVDNLTLDKDSVSVSSEKTGFIARVEDHGGGARVYGIQDPNITEIFRNGVALCGQKLRPVGQSKLLPAEVKMLASGKQFGLKELPELASEVIPQLRKKLPVEVLARNLPEMCYSSPRFQLISTQQEDRLTILAKVVYGDPVIASIERGRMVLIKGSQVPVRDRREEQRIQAKIYNDLALVPDTQVTYSGEDAVQFAERIRVWQVNHRGLIDEQALKNFYKQETLVPRMHLSNENEQYFCAMEFSTQDGKGQTLQADPEQVLAAWNRGESLVPLLTGGWAPLPRKWLEENADLISGLINTKQESSAVSPCMLPQLADLYEKMGEKIPSELKQIKESIKDFTKIPAKALPQQLNAELRDYQQQSYNWMSFLRDSHLGGALLADDMGLGKTLQAICILKGKCLVVAPMSVLYNWENEIRKFRPNLSINVFHGSKRKFDDNVDIHLTSYALLRINIEHFQKIKWDIIVLDEAQTIKNPDSKVAQSAYKLQAGFRLALTGTPVENRLEDMWSQFHFLNAGFLGPLKSFQNNYVKAITSGNASVAENLRYKLKPFLLRRTKEEVALELPPRTEHVLYCELNEKERKIYDSIKASTQKDVIEKLNLGGNVLQILEVLLRLRQAACHPGLIPGTAEKNSTKLDLLVTSLQKCIESGHKALVFSQWTTFLDLIAQALNTQNIIYKRIDGSTKKRGEIVDAFQNKGDVPVLLLSLKAAGVGLNLTAADYVFIVDPWWNPAAEDQAADRAHRIGQNKPVFIHRLVAKDTVEERIIQLQEKKKSFFKAVVDAQNSPMQLSREDLLSLFSEN